MHTLEIPTKFHPRENGGTHAFSLFSARISRFRAAVAGSQTSAMAESALVVSGSGFTRQ